MMLSGHMPHLPPTTQPTPGYELRKRETYEEMRERCAEARAFDRPDESLVGNTYGLLYIESSAPHAMGIRYKWHCTHCGKRGACPGSYLVRGRKKTCGAEACQKYLLSRRGRRA